MTREEWKACDYKSVSTPPIRHLVCGAVVESTSINCLTQGQGVGCSCNKLTLWKYRKAEIVKIGDERGFDVLTPDEEWIEKCTGNEWRPTLRCRSCKEVVQGTMISSLGQGGGAGCRCNNDNLKHWKYRKAEIVALGDERGFDVLTPDDEWVAKCTGAHWCPTLQCRSCKEVVQSTRINSLDQKGGAGCTGCRNKTECLLHKWLEDRFPTATITRQFRGPSSTRFDFHLRFPDGFQILIELDGPQHFWSDAYHFSEEACDRDVDKEAWAIKARICVVRVLQDDVWADRFGWREWIAAKVSTARMAEAPAVFAPDAPEYSSKKSAYVRRRTSACSPGVS